MKLIHNDLVSAEALTPKTSSTSEAPVKQASKPAGFQSLLKNFGSQHAKPVPVKAVDPSETKSDAGSKSDTKPDVSVGLLPTEVEDTKAAVDTALPDPAGPVLWAQMQMTQGQMAQVQTTQAQMTQVVPTDVCDAKAVAAADPRAIDVSPVQLNTQAGAALATARPVKAGPEAQLQSAAAEAVKLDLTQPGVIAPPSVGGAKAQASHGGVNAKSWVTDLGNLVAAANVQKQGSEQAAAIMDKQSTLMLATEVSAVASQSAAIDGLQTDQKRTSVSIKGGFESGQTLYTSQGLDMTSQANQTAVSLGVSATLPVDAAPETAIANQVAVWVSQNIQSAELKLDAQGSDPVEVSISLAGNQATVEFRCDTAETRDMLNRAADQLDAMLLSEGIVLSGVSVGASSQQQARDQATPSRPGGAERLGRAGGVGQASASTQTLNLVPRAKVSEGSVDVFV